LSLIPCGIATEVETANLVWNLNGETLELPHFVSSSNEVFEDGFVEVKYSDGYLLMVEIWKG
jgi:thiamine pyrophosphokinase